MDGLGDYGTDSSDEQSNVDDNEKQEGLKGLLSTYSDDDDDNDDDNDDDDDDKKQSGDDAQMKEDTSSVQVQPQGKSGDDTNDQVKESDPPKISNERKRRRRRWDNSGQDDDNDETNDNHTNKNSSTLLQKLPPPRLADPNGADNPFDALILFDEDFVTPRLSRARPPKKEDQESKDKMSKLEEKLNGMYKHFHENKDTTTLSFASQLKQQKDYGNPHLLPSIIDHYGIYEHGTNLPKELWDPQNDFSPFEYTDQLLKKEEENRIRQFSEMNK